MSIQIGKKRLTKKIFYTDYMKYMHAVSETLVFSVSSYLQREIEYMENINQFY